MEDKEMKMKEFKDEAKDSGGKVVNFLNKEINTEKDQHIASIFAGSVLEKEGGSIQQKSCIRIQGTNIAIVCTIVAMIDHIAGNFDGDFDNMLKLLKQVHKDFANEDEVPEVLN